jgi:hypothetical protein
MNPLVAEPLSVSARSRVGALLFVSDGTLPSFTGSRSLDPALNVDFHLARARLAGLLLGLVASPREARGRREQSGVIRRLDDLFGPFDVVATCFHGTTGSARCRCVGVDSGAVRAAAAALRLPPSQCLLVGATPGDVSAATAAGAWGAIMSVADAIDTALESLSAPDRALEHSLEALESTWKNS